MRSRSPDNTHTSSRFLLRHLGTTALALAVLTGCASKPVQPKPDANKVKQFAGQGYLTDDHYSIATTFATWAIDDSNFDVALTLPAKQGSFPLVIYLPGLGESRSAGEVWRTAWAQGGYAVLVVQPLEEDAAAWSSAQARSGDFAALARDRYSANSMTKRLNVLRQVMDELLRRLASKEVPDRIDTSHIAIAGYDLGAYAAMVIAGETMRGFVKPALPMPISAVIALSPYASFSGMAFTERYSAIRVPVLSVTSNDDSDSLGVVNSPSLRQAPFEYMPSGDKYLLTMSDIPHSMMSGNKAKPDDNEKKSFAEKGGHGGDGNSQGKGKGHHGTHHKSNGDSDSTGTPGGGDMASGVYLSPTSQAMSGVAIQGVMVAFLDAFVKNDPMAREWLGKDAPRWLGKKGGIKIR